MPDLSTRQSEILAIIRKSIADRGYPPTLGEIADYLGISSRSTISYHLQGIADLGYIRIDARTSRGLVVLDVDQAPEAPAIQLTYDERRDLDAAACSPRHAPGPGVFTCRQCATAQNAVIERILNDRFTAFAALASELEHVGGGLAPVATFAQGWNQAHASAAERLRAVLNGQEGTRR